MLSTPYTQKVRPYFDRPDLEVDIVWYPCNPGAKTLPFPTVFNSNLWSGDWWQRAEVVGPVGFVGTNNWERPKINAPGLEPCMSEEQALFGVAYDPELVCERVNGIPECCGLAIIAAGGVIVGGATFPLFPRGGAVVGGATFGVAEVGGAVVGGEPEFVPGCDPLTAASDCFGALPALTANDCWLLTGTGQRWAQAAGFGGAMVRVELLTVTAGATVRVWQGVSCFFLTLLGTLTTPGDFVDVDTTGPAWWVNMNYFGPGTQSVEFSVTALP